MILDKDKTEEQLTDELAEMHWIRKRIIETEAEYKQAEAKLQCRNRELALLNRVIAVSAASLELDTIYGIVKQNGGSVWVEMGQGSTFKIHLPCVEAVASPLVSAEAKAITEMPTGNETILLVEDNTQVRGLTQSVLEGQGYTEETIAHHGIVDLNVAFLSKPFSPTALAHEVREVLDAC